MSNLLLFFIYSLAWAALLIGSVALAAFIQTLLYRWKDRHK